MKANTTTKARRLRRNSTEAEKKLWHALRNRQFLNLKFRRQHPIPPYIIDFYCEDLKLAIELDGGQHDEMNNRLYDERRTACLEQQGIQIARFWNNEVLGNLGGVLTVLEQEITRRSPHPAPLPGGEGKEKDV